jgi:phage N-6-adenine-methyltransferase
MSEQLKPRIEIVESQFKDFIALDKRVDGAEGEGLRARWEFGRLLLAKRVGKQLPKGLLDDIARETGKSRQELGYRMQFAEKFPTEEEVSNAVGKFGSWHGIVNEALAGKMDVHYSSETGEWETPQDLFDLLDSEFRFEIDVCADSESAKCQQYFSRDNDGLTQSWGKKRCWMNPPYGHEIEGWMEKAFQESKSGSLVVCLIPARVDTAWWWDYCRYGEIRFLRGRLRFGDSLTSAPFPSAVVIFGQETKVVWWETWPKKKTD